MQLVPLQPGGIRTSPTGPSRGSTCAACGCPWTPSRRRHAWSLSRGHTDGTKPSRRLASLTGSRTRPRPCPSSPTSKPSETGAEVGAGAGAKAEARMKEAVAVAVVEAEAEEAEVEAEAEAATEVESEAEARAASANTTAYSAGRCNQGTAWCSTRGRYTARRPTPRACTAAGRCPRGGAASNRRTPRRRGAWGSGIRTFPCRYWTAAPPCVPRFQSYGPEVTRSGPATTQTGGAAVVEAVGVGVTVGMSCCQLASRRRTRGCANNRRANTVWRAAWRGAGRAEGSSPPRRP
jgi:hypothetical protein